MKPIISSLQSINAPQAAGREPPLVWLMLGACAAMVGMAFGAIVNIAVFITPLAIEFDWPRGDLSLAYALVGIGTGLGGIAMGHFADRVPIRRLALCGAVVPGVAFLLLSRLNSTFELYLYHAMMGLIGTAALLPPLNRLAGLWLARKPGVAIGIVSAGGALGQGLMPFFIRELVIVEGWRDAYSTLGLTYLAVMVPLALLLRDPPQPDAAPASATHTANPYGAPRTRLLGWLCVAVAFCCICMATPIVHVATLGADLGLGARTSAGLLTVMMVFGMAGRVAFGRIADRMGNLQAYILASGGQTALAFAFPLMSTLMELYVLAALFGLAFSGAMTSFILCAREWSPPGHTGLAIGLVTFFGWAGMALGAWQGGIFYDLCGSYVPSFAHASLGGVANLLVLGLLYLLAVHRPRAARGVTIGARPS